MPVRRDLRTPEGEDVYVLACNATREASNTAYAGILRLQHDIDARHADIDWWEANASTRTGRLFASRMLFLIAVSAAIILSAVWLRYTDGGRTARIGLVTGNRTAEKGAVSPWDQPHWITSDMSRAQIEELSARAAAERARKEQP